MPSHNFPTTCLTRKHLSLKNAYITCIEEQLINALNDKERLKKIYNGLTKHLLVKYGGSLNLSRISQDDSIKSPITKTLYLITTTSGAHSRTTFAKFLLFLTPLETQWMRQTQNKTNI